MDLRHRGASPFYAIQQGWRAEVAGSPGCRLRRLRRWPRVALTGKAGNATRQLWYQQLPAGKGCAGAGPFGAGMRSPPGQRRLRAALGAARLRRLADERDIELRRAALEHVRELQRRYDDLVPVLALRDGFQFHGQRVSFGSFFSGIFRPKEMTGPAALALVTTAPRPDARPPTRTSSMRRPVDLRSAFEIRRARRWPRCVRPRPTTAP